jgi:putative nucleotidyltransferase with HDIG domain
VARVTMAERVGRSLTLLWAFVGVSAVILAVGGLVLGAALASALRQQALDDARAALSQYTNGVIAPRLVYGTELRVGDRATGVIRADLTEHPEILSVKVWRKDGVLAWTSIDQSRIGRKYELSSHLRDVVGTGEAEAEFEELGDDEDAVEAKAFGSGKVLEVYAPVMSGGEPIGAYEVYADASRLEASIAERARVIWIVVATVFVSLWLLLLLLARGASITMRRQTAALRERSLALSESYRRLEESSLEAIESLNATVEAKDPYTAGHSQRVQRIALALGAELGLSPKELDALRFGGLFHDIGKIAVPDVLLTKPGRLTPEEYELMKRHSAEGARIVAKFSRLRDSVPIIRHHHERWDGKGYPDGLALDEIPVAAAIAGLADAWDAMTIERPYQRALTIAEAMAEVRDGRGTQFAPQVVDAFFSALRKRPADFGIPDADAVALAAG